LKSECFLKTHFEQYCIYKQNGICNVATILQSRIEERSIETNSKQSKIWKGWVWKQRIWFVVA